ncbi:hypothetical protein BC826DRAFT_889139, partial [Russula brevipes]
PFCWGDLLYSIPGSGKSSLIHAFAGELMLSSSWINDSTLTTLMARVPSRCIILLEDLDAAFTRSVSRAMDKDKKRSDSKSHNDESTMQQERRSSNKEKFWDVNTLTLSGLLNVLNG